MFISTKTMYNEQIRLEKRTTGAYLKLIKQIAQIIAVVGSYVAAAKIGFLMAIPPGNVTAVWPPSGIALAAVLVLGYRVWPGIWLGSFLANFLFFINLSAFSVLDIVTSFAIGTGSTLQALLGAFLIRRLTKTSYPLDRGQDVFKFAGIELVSCTVAATFGVTTLCLCDHVLWTAYLYTWLTWWLGDLTGVLIFTPVILLCKKRPLFINQPLRMAEILLFLVLMYALSFIVFRKEPSLIYALIPFISWAAFRFGQHGVGISGLMMSGLAIYFTSKGFGPFVRESLNDSFLLLQFFVGNVIVTGLALAGVLTERRKTEQMKTEFISTISHELKTPLTAIKGSLEIVQGAVSESFSDEVKGLVRIAVRNVERLRRLVNDLLDSQKLELRKVDFVIKRVELDSLIEQSIELNQFFSDQYGVEIVLANKLPGVRVHVDSERIIQVMNNLISNAAKFSPSKGSIRISMLKRDHFIRVTVTDSGPGIPAEFQRNIFQKFSYSDSPGRRGREGTGLGLWISKTIIEKHSGRIGYEANPNGGTTFYFELPSA